MFVALLAFWMLRFLFTVAMVAVAIVLAVAACLGVIVAGIVGQFNEERGAVWHQSAVLLINSAIGVAKVAEGRRTTRA